MGNGSSESFFILARGYYEFKTKKIQHIKGKQR